eukprot:9865110-Alexandrium_andersonii.AAC.1
MQRTAAHNSATAQGPNTEPARERHGDLQHHGHHLSLQHAHDESRATSTHRCSSSSSARWPGMTMRLWPGDKAMMATTQKALLLAEGHGAGTSR